MTKKKKGPWNKKYPWDDWFRRKRPFVLVQDVDFECMMHSMAQQVRSAASSRGVLVSLSIHFKQLTVRVL